MAMFTGFKPSGMQKIANRLGYKGDMVNFDNYLEQNPDKKRQMVVFEDAARKMAEGGLANLRQQQEDQLVAQGMFQGVGTNQLSNLNNNFTQGFTPGYQGSPTIFGGNASRDKFRQLELDRRKQVGKAPVLRDYKKDLKEYDLTKIDERGFAPLIGGGGGTKVQYHIDKAQKDYNEQLAKHQEYQKMLGQNYTIGQAEDYDRKKYTIEKNKHLKAFNPKLDLNFFDSPEYKNINFSGPATRDVVFSPYFGMQGSGSTSRAQDAAYQAYLKRTGQENLITEGVVSEYDLDEFGRPPGFTDRLGSYSELDPRLRTRTDPNELPDPRDAVAKANIPGAISNRKGPGFGQPIEPMDILDRQQAYVPTIGSEEGQIPVFGTQDKPKGIQDATAIRAQTGALPVGAVTQPELTPFEQSQLIDPSTGMGQANVITQTAQAGLQQAGTTTGTAAQVTPVVAQEAVQNAIDTNQAAQTNVSDNAQILAAQQTASSVANLDAAQGNAILMSGPAQRAIREGELIGSVTNAEVAKTFTEQIGAATATASESATVAGQLATLTANFDATNPPAWAAGAIRGVQSIMQQRGLGASSIAGQALVQAAMESALPIAQADANTVRTFELQNLSNRQQRAMLAAQQRASFIGQEFDQAFQARVQNAAKISDIANRNFTAEQQIQLENSRIANTVNLQNLSNRQALVLAEASALTGLDTSNLTNRQQAAVENAKAFLQVDMANLSNQQQTGMFNMQQLTQSILTDQAALNAARQFNATSQNQVDQFFANLRSQVEQFNATQSNAQDQFNAGEMNTLARFNAEVMNARDQFNAQNQIAIAQNNAVWRRELATADTAAINRANELNAKAVLDISNEAYNDLWAFFADTMEWAWKSAENEQDRINALGVANISKEAQAYTAQQTKKASGSTALGNMVATLGSAIIKGMP